MVAWSTQRGFQIDRGRAYLVTAHLSSNVIEGVDERQAKPLPLVVFRDGNVFDVALDAEFEKAALVYQHTQKHIEIAEPVLQLLLDD